MSRSCGLLWKQKNKSGILGLSCGILCSWDGSNVLGCSLWIVRDLVSMMLWRRNVQVLLDSDESSKSFWGGKKKWAEVEEYKGGARKWAKVGWRTPDEAAGGERLEMLHMWTTRCIETRPEVSPVAAERGQQEASAAPQMQLKSCLASQLLASHRRDQQGNCHSSPGVTGSSLRASIAVMKPVKLCILLGSSTAMLTWQLWKSCCFCTKTTDLFCLCLLYCQAQISI